MDTPDGPWAYTRTPSSRPASQKSARSSRSARSHRSSRTSEVTPLLARADGSDEEGDDDEQTPATASLPRSLSPASSSSSKAPFWKKRWPSILALVILCIAVALILVGFLATEDVEEYAMQAADFKPTRLSLDSLTEHGVKIHVEGDFTMDASKVKKRSVRNLGRFGMWIAREVESGPTTVDVYLPEYGNVLVGTAKIPGIKVNVRNGHTTHLSFFARVDPGSFDGIRNVANDWMKGSLDQIRLKGTAIVPLKSGLIRLGSQIIDESLVFQGHNLPSLPRYNITRLNIREAKDGHRGMGADVTVAVTNDFPVQITVPPVAVDVLVDGCPLMEKQKHIKVGTAESAKLEITPKSDLEVNVTGRIEKLPDSLIEVCPDSAKSPLDALLGDYMQGQDATVYINCCTFPDPETPKWAGDLLQDITVPIPFAGRDMGNLIKDFSLADVHFHLPEPFADPGTPEASPKISATVKVVIGVPREMNFPVGVDGVKADSIIYYKKKRLGKMDLSKWQHANSTRVDAHDKEGPSLLVQSEIDKAPIEILDDNLFSEVVQALIFGSRTIMMEVRANVSVKVDTPMGDFAVRGIPTKGVVPVKPIDSGKGGHDGIGAVAPRVGNLSIVGTSPTSLILQVHVNFTNPTNYSATIPYFNINVLVNGTVLGQGVVRDTVMHPGNNTDLVVCITWDPSTNSGEEGKEVGRELLSRYISGYNTSITLQTHNRSIPAQPAFGALLSNFPITLPAPSLSGPKGPDDGDDGPDDGDDKKSRKPHFIREATMHLISSTAVFTLASPFSSTTMYITNLNATALHEGKPAGKIISDLPFAVPPGLSTSPRLPVDWSFGSLGYEAIKKALGGTLKLGTFAEVGIRVGEWRQQVWFQGGQIGAHVRL